MYFPEVVPKVFHETDLHEERKEGTGRLGRKEGEKEGRTGPLGWDRCPALCGWVAECSDGTHHRPLTVTQEGDQVTNYK